MDEQLLYFLKGTRIDAEYMQSRLRHPVTGVKFPARNMFVQLRKYADGFFRKGSEPRMIALAGLRGTGKTTLLWHLAEYIHEHITQEVFFFNVNILNDLDVPLREALKAFETHILKASFSEYKKPVVLLIDEVQDDPRWSKALKMLYDEAPNVFVVCTGSSALLLHQSADLARRMHTVRVFPFKFTEFFLAKTRMEQLKEELYPRPGLAQELKEALFFSATAEEVMQQVEKLKYGENSIEEYWKKAGFIKEQIEGAPSLKSIVWEYISFKNIPGFLMHEDKYAILDDLFTLIKRVVYEDLPKLHLLEDPLRLTSRAERLLLRLAASDEINPEKLSGLIGLKKSETEALIQALHQAELIHLLFPFGGQDSRILKNKKAFFMSPSLRRTLLSQIYGRRLEEPFKAQLLEDLVVMYLKRILPESIITFSASTRHSNPDLVIETRQTPVLLEISTGSKSLRQTKKSKIKHRYAIFVSEEYGTIRQKEHAVFLPLWYFLLL